MTDQSAKTLIGLTRVFVSPDNIDGDIVRLDADTSKRLARVMRLEPGDYFGVLDGLGNGWTACIIECGKHGGMARLEHKALDISAPRRTVEMALPLIKGERLEFALQKCTEIGVSAFHIVPFERSVVLPDNMARKLERYRSIVESAAQQCGAFQIPDITFWEDCGEFRAQIQPVKRFIAWEKGQNCLPPFGITGDEPCLLASGPEGGISVNEMDEWIKDGFKPVSLGNRILRAETAAVALAVLALVAERSC